MGNPPDARSAREALIVEAIRGVDTALAATDAVVKWRRQHVHKSVQAAPPAATLLPVCVIPADASTLPARPVAPVAPAASAGTPSARPGVIEIEIAGAQLRLRGPVDEATLSRVLRALRQSA